MNPARFHELCRRMLLLGIPPAAGSITVPAAGPPPDIELSGTPPDLLSLDQEARRYGDLYRSAYWANFLLGSVAVGLALLTIGLPSSGHVFIGLEMIVILTILGLYVTATRRGWHRKWLDNRRQAELARYQPLMSVADPSRPPSPLLEQQVFWMWIRRLLAEQVNYHDLRAHTERSFQRRVRMISFICFGLTAVAVLAHVFIDSQWLSITAAFLPTVAGALTGIMAHAESERLEVDSERISSSLRELLRIAPTASAVPADACRYIERCLDVLLADIDDWHAYAVRKGLTLA